MSIGTSWAACKGAVVIKTIQAKENALSPYVANKLKAELRASNQPLFGTENSSSKQPGCGTNGAVNRPPGPSLAGIFCSVSHDSPLHHELTLIDTCLGGHRGNTMRPWRQTGNCHNEEPVSSS